MEYRDKSLVCVECHQPFVWTAGEQLFYADKNFKNEPKRCKDCKAKRNARMSHPPASASRRPPPARSAARRPPSPSSRRRGGPSTARSASRPARWSRSSTPRRPSTAGISCLTVRRPPRAAVRLHDGDRDQVHDVLHRAAAREVVGRPLAAPAGCGPIARAPADPLHELVADVPGVEIGEDEDVGASRPPRCPAPCSRRRRGPARRPPASRRPPQLGRARAHDARGLRDLARARVVGAAAGGEGQERDARRARRGTRPRSPR